MKRTAMQRNAVSVLLALSAVCSQGAASETSSGLRAPSSEYTSHHQRRELSWWNNFFNLLHGPHHGSSSGRSGNGNNSNHASASYWNSQANGGGDGGNGDGGSSSSGNVDYSSGGNGDYSGNGENSQYVTNNSGGGDGSSNGSYSNGDSDVELTYTDDVAYSSQMVDSDGNVVDNYEASYLGGGGGGSSMSGSSMPDSTSSNLWPFIVAALCAASVGTALMVSRKRGGLKAFAAPLDDDESDDDSAPAFVEIAKVRSERDERYSAPWVKHPSPAPSSPVSVCDDVSDMASEVYDDSP